MRTAILYAYYETQYTKFNLDFYSKIGITESNDLFYIIVINGYNCTVDLPKLDNLIILKRENSGFDFGAHNHALEWLTNNNMTFDYYIFLNASVVGPFLPSYYPKSLHWSNIFIDKLTEKVKLVGTVISCLPPTDLGGFGPKVGGYCFATDSVGLDILKKHGGIFSQHNDKISAIVAEYNVSNAIIRDGYTIDCLMYRYENVDWTDKNNWILYNNVFPDRLNSNDGISIHPFEVVFQKYYWAHHGNNLIFYDYCKKYADWKLK